MRLCRPVVGRYERIEDDAAVVFVAVTAILGFFLSVLSFGFVDRK